MSSVARHYTERLSVQGIASELAIRQWARTDSAAVTACASVDEARIKVAGQLYLPSASRSIQMDVDIPGRSSSAIVAHRSPRIPSSITRPISSAFTVVRPRRKGAIAESW